MRRAPRGRPVAAALFVCLALPVPADELRVVGEDGERLVGRHVEEGTTWCLSWNHSVTGGAVKDCFADHGGRMMLERSYLHDFAAGLGEVPGRGHLVPAEGGGYWIEDMDEPIGGNILPLRVGHRPVDHHLRVGGTDYALSRMAEGRRVTIRLVTGP